MVHFTCDMCGKELLVDEETRFVVNVEVHAAYDPMEITEADLESDIDEEIRELVNEMKEMDAEELEDQVRKTFRFDLCPSCWEQYIADPLGSVRGVPRHSRRFSTN